MEDDLTKYSIIIADMNQRAKIKLRAFLDLRHHKFKEHQRHGITGSFNDQYQNHLADNNILQQDMKLNKGVVAHRLLDVGVTQYLIISLIRAEDENWFDKQAWVDGAANELKDETLNEMISNMVDLLIVKGENAPSNCKKLNQKFQDAVGCRTIHYAQDPSNMIFKDNPMGISNCANLYGSFQFQSYTYIGSGLRYVCIRAGN